MLDFDIFEYAETHKEDYYDEEDQKLYHVKEFRRLRRMGIPVHGIKITSPIGGVTHVWKD